MDGDSIPALNAAVLILLVVVLIVFLTELTSNQATTATFIPIMIPLALAEQNLLPGDSKDLSLIAQLAIPVALASSCAFMLPVATPPNAIVYGSEKFSIGQMMRAGFQYCRNHNCYGILYLYASINILMLRLSLILLLSLFIKPKSILNTLTLFTQQYLIKVWL